MRVRVKRKIILKKKLFVNDVIMIILCFPDRHYRPAWKNKSKNDRWLLRLKIFPAHGVNCPFSWPSDSVKPMNDVTLPRYVKDSLRTIKLKSFFLPVVILHKIVCVSIWSVLYFDFAFQAFKEDWYQRNFRQEWFTLWIMKYNSHNYIKKCKI